MIETKSGDLDVLEARVKRLRTHRRIEKESLEDALGGMSLSLSSSASPFGRSAASRDGTPLRNSTASRSIRTSTPQYDVKSRSQAGRFEVPDDSSEEEDGEGENFATPEAKSKFIAAAEMDERVEAYIRGVRRRDYVLGVLREKVRGREMERGGGLSEVN